MSRRPASDVAFTPSVKAAQTRLGSRAAYRRMEEGPGWETTITPELEAFLAERDSFYLATATREGQPYIQHRGGAKGFLRALDARTLAFADFAGNRQYITLGNLEENPRAFLFVMDYESRRRVKVWGSAEWIEDADLLSKLTPPGSSGRAERVIVFHVSAWDVNCPKYIPQKLDAALTERVIEELEARVRMLETENAALRSQRS